MRYHHCGGREVAGGCWGGEDEDELGGGYGDEDGVEGVGGYEGEESE